MKIVLTQNRLAAVRKVFEDNFQTKGEIGASVSYNQVEVWREGFLTADYADYADYADFFRSPLGCRRLQDERGASRVWRAAVALQKSVSWPSNS